MFVKVKFCTSRPLEIFVEDIFLQSRVLLQKCIEFVNRIFFINFLYENDKKAIIKRGCVYVVFAKSLYVSTVINI